MFSLKNMIRCIHNTLDFDLHLYHFSIDNLITYIDEEYGGCQNTKMSTYVYCVYLGDNLVYWSSKQITYVVSF